jgi:glycosyltransferase involved in cell wall biosynthesis
MEAPLVSVIVPTYNRAYCLARAVDSALGQTHQNVEVILIDDGSTDNTAAQVLEKYGSEARVRYTHQANTGISGARNAGISRARGEYVALLDSDDVWLPWKLEAQLACMHAHPELGMTWTDMIAIDPDERVVDEAYLRRMYGAYRWYPEPRSLFQHEQGLDTLLAGGPPETAARKFHYGDISSQMLMGNLVHTSTVLMTRACADEIKSFREDLRLAGEDYEFHLRTCRRGPVGYLDVSSIHYQVGRSDQATKPANAIALARNFLAVIQPILATDMDKINLPDSMQDAVLAEAHLWYGETLLDAGDQAAARREILASLTRVLAQPRAARMLMMACFPRSVREAAHSAYRLLRGRRASLSP